MTQEEAEVRLKVNNKDALDKINQLEDEAAKLRQKFSECFAKGDTRGIKKTTEELTKVNKQIQNMRTNAANIEAAMKRLNEASPKELRRTLNMINAELNSGRVPRGSKEWKGYCEQLKAVKRELAEINEEMEDEGSMLDNLKDKFNDWGAAAAAAVAGFAGIVMSGKAAVQAYADMEAEEANVRKFTGMTAEQVKSLNNEFKKIDTRTSREELNQLAQEAGRLGKTSEEDVLGFVVAANQINVALDDLGEGATLTLSKLTGIFGDEERLGTERSLLAVGSVINELSQNCSASAPYLADFSKRLAGVGAQAKMTIPQIMAYAAVLDSQGQNLEASATALSQLIMSLYMDPAKFAKAAGLDVKKFTELLKTDANEAVIVLLDTLNKLGGMEKLAPIFEEMGTDGARASAVMAALAGNIDTVRKQQVNANIAFNEATSVTKEYEVQNSTVQAGLDKAKKGFTEMAVSLGEKLVPVMRYAISGTSMLMRVMDALATFILEHKNTIVSLTLGVAAYTIAIKANTIATTTWTLITKAGALAGSALRTTVNLAGAAFYALSGQTRKATVCMKAFNTAIKTNPIGLLVGLITTSVAALINWNSEMEEAERKEREMREETERFRAELRNIDQQSAEYSKNEITRLKALYEEATNEAKSKQNRITAAKTLQDMYPDYFKNLSIEQIMVGDARVQYDQLTESIINTARARAAAAKIEENEGKLFELESELERKKTARDKKAEEEKKAHADYDTAHQEMLDKTHGAALGDTREMRSNDNQAAIQNSNNAQDRWRDSREALSEAQNAVDETQRQIDDINAANKELAEKYKISSEDLNKTLQTTNFFIPTTTFGETEKERKEREKREREARKAEAEAKKKLQEEIDKQKAIRDRDEAANIAAYSSGQIDYLKFMERKSEIDQQYIDNRRKVYQKANRTESDDYAALIKEEEQLKAKQLERKKATSLREAEISHKSNTNELTMSFFDPNSQMFQNHKAYNQALLDEDIRYLTEKRDLYQAGSNEWEQINAEINQRVAQDKLNKQKETAEALLAYSKKYQDNDRKSRLQAEDDLLNQLHDKGLMSEEEYQRALKIIRNRYRDEETQARKTASDKRHQEIEKEYEETKEIMANSTDIFGKTILDMMISWEKMCDDMKNNGEGFWTSFGDFAKNALSLASAMLSQYSAYSNAERDVELAKIEKRYDDEIKAAGKNTKKKERLEKQKEEAIAKTKKKYNDKAMKIEIAQAIAQSAVNAILGYQAGLKFPFPANTFMPAVLAGLAVAQGAIQIATIKKQHEAQSAGYYEGGFTGGNNYRREAGVVHEGEFIANHQAVNNPALSPLLRLLDTAQRNNTVGSLTAEDVSNALGQGRGVSARGEVAATVSPTIVTNEVDTTPIDRLNDLLADGIDARVTIAGEDGFDRKYRDFQRMQNNPKR